MRKNKFTAVLIFIPVFLCSCFGVNAGIVINPDNSGTIALEYRISRLLESLGAQDGNERWLPLPVGRADFERSLQRLPGMRLVSFSSKREGGDLVNTVNLQFSGMEALVNFLDPNGEKAKYEGGSGSNRLLLYLTNNENRNYAPGSPVAELFNGVSTGYSVNITLDLPAEGTLAAQSTPGLLVTPIGKKLSFSAPVSSILNSGPAVSLDFRWPQP